MLIFLFLPKGVGIGEDKIEGWRVLLIENTGSEQKMSRQNCAFK